MVFVSTIHRDMQKHSHSTHLQLTMHRGRKAIFGWRTPHLSGGVAVGALTCIGHVKPPIAERPYARGRRPLPMLLRGLLSAVSDSRSVDAPPCGDAGLSRQLILHSQVSVAML